VNYRRLKIGSKFSLTPRKKNIRGIDFKKIEGGEKRVSYELSVGKKQEDFVRGD